MNFIILRVKINLVVCLWILYVMSWFNPDMCYIHIIIRFYHVQFCTNECPYYYMFCYAQLCTNDYAYYSWFSSWKYLYEWLSIFLWVLVMRIFVRMTILIIKGFCHTPLCVKNYPYYNGFSSCTSLCEWLSIFLWVFVMHSFVRMTNHII